MSELRCDRARERITRLVDGELGARAAGELERHLARCETCAREKANLEAMRAAYRDLPALPSIAEDRARIVRAARQASASRTAAPSRIESRLARFLGRRAFDLVTAGALVASCVLALWLRGIQSHSRTSESRRGSGSVLTLEEYRCQVNGRPVEAHGRVSLGAPE